MGLGAGEAALSVVLFAAAGLLEVAGGWLVWGALRAGRPGWWAALGALLLVGYGFVPCAQPLEDFGRIYAVYGGFFIVLSLVWGWLLDGFRPDIGDMVGAGIALAGVLIMMVWPRGTTSGASTTPSSPPAPPAAFSSLGAPSPRRAQRPAPRQGGYTLRIWLRTQRGRGRGGGRGGMMSWASPPLRQRRAAGALGRPPRCAQ